LLNFLTEDESCDLEAGILEDLAKKGHISVYKHRGLWACMDHERDLNYLETIWKNNNAFWKVW
jgi:glucose-1-phosphate cytidylyltransferase